MFLASSFIPSVQTSSVLGVRSIGWPSHKLSERKKREGERALTSVIKNKENFRDRGSNLRGLLELMVPYLNVIRVFVLGQGVQALHPVSWRRINIIIKDNQREAYDHSRGPDHKHGDQDWHPSWRVDECHEHWGACCRSQGGCSMWVIGGLHGPLWLVGILGGVSVLVF